MSEDNGKVCCSCRNCIRTKDNGRVSCTCKFFNGFMGYLQVMTGWCRHWARERKWDNEYKLHDKKNG